MAEEYHQLNNVTEDSNNNSNSSLIIPTPPPLPADHPIKKKRGRPPKINTAGTDHEQQTTKKKQSSKKDQSNIKSSFGNDDDRGDRIECPLCKSLIATQDMSQHYQWELSRIASDINDINEQATLVRPKRMSSINALNKSNNNNNNSHRGDSPLDQVQSSLDTIREKRLNRTKPTNKRSSINQQLNNQTSLSNAPQPTNTITTQPPQQQQQQQCIVCGIMVRGGLLNLQLHVEQCLQGGNVSNGSSSSLADTTSPTRKSTLRESKGKRKNKDESEEEEEEQDEYEFPDDVDTYTIGGVTRIRMSSLLPNGSYEGILFDRATSQRKHQDDEGDLEIEQDDTVQYGANQYTEDHIKRNNNNNNNQQNNNSSSSTTRTTSTTKQLKDVNNNNNNMTPNSSSSSSSTSNNFIVEALKQRIRDQEEMLKNVPNCLVCMGRYQIPVVSIKCWHVHCEQCWMNTLGVKKWCPQCNIITTPSELRKIYL